MTRTDEIVRLAARGDGVTESGEHVEGALPGDVIGQDGSLVQGSHHVAPPCEHFSLCGGCQLQHADDEMLSAFVHDRAVNAARGQGVEPDEVLPVHLSPPRARRRATLHAIRVKSGAVLGFRQRGSHRLVDLMHCPVLCPELEALIAPLRTLVATHGSRANVDVAVSLADQGVDVMLAHFPLEGLATIEAALDFARENSLARLTVDQGYGPETLWEPDPVTVSLSGVPVPMPAGAFLQATRDAEQRMIADVCDWAGGSRIVADLFAGLGTFAFALAQGGPTGRKVLAAEADQAAISSCKAASGRSAGKVLTIHRDLFRNPLQPLELDRMDAVVLDPPRAGAKAQIAQIVQSSVRRAVYVSCNPSSWARDAAVLTNAGFRLVKLRPVGQFRWSTHVELVSLFVRE